MKNKLGPSLLVLGYLLILTSDIFFMNHLMGARKVYWLGFSLSGLGGLWTLIGFFRRKDA